MKPLKPLKLLYLTSRNYLAIFFGLLVLFFGVFYFILRFEVTQNIDEILFNRKNYVVETFIAKGGRVPFEEFSFTDFTIAPISGGLFQDIYSDTLIFEKTDQELDEYRKLTTSFSLDNKNYKLEIVKAHLEAVEIINTVVISLGLIFILMLAVFYFTTRFYSVRLWYPFYHSLNQLKKFEVEKSSAIELVDTRIEEFNELNKSIQELTERARSSFIHQKQFIENASHELQTPLAVIQNQLEMWIGDPALTEDHSEKIRMLLDSTQRLSRLNKTLLLLSKIENLQFFETESNDVKALVEKILTYFEGQQENLEIQVSLNLSDITIQANPILLDVLITNLIKNSFLHNVPKGSIHIQVTGNAFEICNTSSSSEIPRGKLFQRFFKQSDARDGWGLGLAIAKKICEVNAWVLVYNHSENRHVFKVYFTEKHGRSL
jgi:signal transduction histidine kinase